MTVGSMAKPLEKLKKLRSWNEIRTRGGQALSAYREQRNGASIPTDEEFIGLIDPSQFGTSPIIDESLWQQFYEHGEKAFFRSIAEPRTAGKNYRRLFGEQRAAS